MAKMMQFNEGALNAILRGIRVLAKAVVVTLGPRGRNVVICKGMGMPLSTKDGVTVAKEIALKDKFENIGAQLLKEAAAKTSDVAGDGTTSAIVLGEIIFREGVKNVIAGVNPMSIKRGLDKAVQYMLDELDRIAKPLNRQEEVEQIATISANNDPAIGKIIAEAMAKVGKDGTVTIADAKGFETLLEVVEGMQFDKGYLSPYFVTNSEKMSTELSGVRVLVTDKKLSSSKELVPILEKVIEAGHKPLLIIAEDIDGDALTTLVLNKLKSKLPVCAVKAPSFGELRKALLQDIAILTGATIVSEEVGLHMEHVGLDVLGSAATVKVDKEKTIIIGGGGRADTIQARIKKIRSEMDSPATSDYERSRLEDRLAKLSGGVAVVSVGAATESEMKERKARVEDSLHATRAAVIGGIVPGGGVALIRAAKALDAVQLEEEEQIGCDIIRRAAFAPAIAIANNCGQVGDLVAERILEREGGFGFNGLKGTYEDLVEAGVVDPVLVTKSALKHATSIASLLITVACMITDKPRPKQQLGTPSAGAGGGMGMPPGMGGMPPGMGGGMPPGMGGMM